MNTNAVTSTSDADAFSRALVARLSQSSDALPHEISERLRVARVQALSRKKQEAAQLAPVWSFQGNASALQIGEGGGFWSKLAVVLPLIALLAGLVSIGWIQDQARANELAQVDSELLTDELPPAAYIDPGFVQFLRKNRAN
jgi:hypothetical protein